MTPVGPLRPTIAEVTTNGGLLDGYVSACIIIEIYLYRLMDDVEFEWDEAKNLSNQKKHGISFEDAARVFGDPLMVLFPDGETDGEERWRAFGQVGGVAVIMVAHTYRNHDDQEKIRIISARIATRHERQAYERENG